MVKNCTLKKRLPTVSMNLFKRLTTVLDAKSIDRNPERESFFGGRGASEVNRKKASKGQGFAV